MKILCSLSGLEFTCEHFPGNFQSRECYHPVFHLPQKALLPYLRKWGASELTPVDSYLLFLALLKSSDLVDFRTPVYRSDKTDSIIYNNMEFLARTVIKLNAVSNPAVCFPSYVITPDTRFLTNVHHWIENWHDEYVDFTNGRKKDYDDRKLARRESALERLIKNPHRTISSYARELAEWSAIAGSFPTFMTSSPWNRTTISCSDYWKEIIVRCSRNELLYSIPEKDLRELLDHCEENVPAGSIHSHALFQVLRKALEKQKNFLGLGDMDIRTNYEILSETDDVESANIKAMIASAPLEQPRIEQYPSKFQYLKAKLRWDMSVKFAAPTAAEGEL